MKIRTVIFGVYVLASAIGLAVLMRFMLAEVRPRYVAAVRANLEDTARLTATALAGRTTADAATVLSRATGFRARLVGRDRRILFDSVVRDARPEEATYAPRGLAKRAGEDLLDGGSSVTETEVAVAADVVLADAGPVRLELSRSFRSVNAVIWTERKKLAVIAMVIAGVMVVAGWWITARLTASLERLTAHAREVRDGRTGQAPHSRVTEIAVLAQAFEEMRDALEGRRHVERYTQALAHEVKAPLAAIRGAAELMQEDMPAEQRERFLANIRSESGRIQQSVERLLELSSLEARKALQRTERLDAGELMEEAANVVRPAYAGAGVTLTVEPGRLPVPGERVLLREALVNLLQNALDFSPAGGAVEFTVSAGDGWVAWSVGDRGAGVPEYALPRVFERFYSLPRPGTTHRSTGLGLALVQEIAHLHGGVASLANRPGGGACATLKVRV